MNEMFRQSLFAGVTISLIAYEIGLFLKRKLGLAILNPLLVSIVIVILALKVFGISYEVYNASAKYISYLLTPATVCLAVPLYEQLELLKKNKVALAKGLALGTASHAIGTARAIEMGPVEGAMSSLAVAVAGLLTVVFVSGFAQLI